MGDLYAAIEYELDLVTEHYKNLNKDGLSLGDIFQLLVSAIASFVRIAQAAEGHTGAERKEAVVKAVEKFYTEVIAPIDLPGVPNFIESSFVDPLLGKAISPIVSGIIDGIVNVLNKTGWGEKASLIL